jgi:autotransporter adhesin
MNRTARIISGIALCLVVSASLQAKEKKIKQSDLPPAVQQTAELQSAGESIMVTGYSKNNVDGQTFYRMNSVADGLVRQTVIGSDGTLVSVQQEMAWDQVPATVQTDFTKVSGKGRLESVSSVTKDGKIVSYEAFLVTGGNRALVSVKPHATVLEPIPTANSK